MFDTIDELEKSVEEFQNNINNSTESPPFSSESYRLRSGDNIFTDISIGALCTVLSITQAYSVS